MKVKVFVCEVAVVEKTISDWLKEVGDVSVVSVSQVQKPTSKQMSLRTNYPDIVTTIIYTDRVGAPAGDPGYGGAEPAKGTPPVVEGYPDCPKCQGKMIVRLRSRDQNPFWGCDSFPECRGIIDFEEGKAQIPERGPVVESSEDYSGGGYDPNDPNIPF